MRPDLHILTDEQLLAQCRFEAFRGPGPGGQKRNKTSSAVRLTHLPSGLAAEAGELRSQHQNRLRALARLRDRLALELRRPVDPAGFAPPTFLRQIVGDDRTLRIARRSPLYAPTVGVVLDLLAANGWQVAPTAAGLGLSTAGLVKFLQRDPRLWAKVNQMRPRSGLKTLRRG